MIFLHKKATIIAVPGLTWVGAFQLPEVLFICGDLGGPPSVPRLVVQRDDSIFVFLSSSCKTEFKEGGQ